MKLTRRAFAKGVAGLFVAAAAGEIVVPEPKIYALGAMPGTEVTSPSQGYAMRLLVDWCDALEPMDTPFLTSLRKGPAIDSDVIVWGPARLEEAMADVWATAFPLVVK